MDDDHTIIRQKALHYHGKMNSLFDCVEQNFGACLPASKIFMRSLVNLISVYKFYVQSTVSGHSFTNCFRISRVKVFTSRSEYFKPFKDTRAGHSFSSLYKVKYFLRFCDCFPRFELQLNVWLMITGEKIRKLRKELLQTN